jgi:hypothetical protein
VHRARTTTSLIIARFPQNFPTPLELVLVYKKLRTGAFPVMMVLVLVRVSALPLVAAGRKLWFADTSS